MRAAVAVRAEGTQEVARDEKDVVSLLRQAVADRVGQELMELWLRDGEALRVECGTLVVCAADDFSLDRVRRTFREPLLQAAEQLLGERPQLLFRVERSLKRAHAASTRRGRAAHVPSNQRLFS